MCWMIGIMIMRMIRMSCFGFCSIVLGFWGLCWIFTFGPFSVLHFGDFRLKFLQCRSFFHCCWVFARFRNFSSSLETCQYKTHHSLCLFILYWSIVSFYQLCSPNDCWWTKKFPWQVYEWHAMVELANDLFFECA